MSIEDANDIPRSFQASLNDALPQGFASSYNYVRSKPKTCDPLFAPPPGQDAEHTRLSSHFLGLTLSTSALEEAILVLGIEVLVYTTRRLTTIFVSKADSTGYTSNGRRAPIRSVCSTFLDWLIRRERFRRPGRPVVISLFARAQAQYLFPGSSEHSGKHILDDRQLIKWWAKVLDPLIETGNKRALTTSNKGRYQGFMVIPGYDATELRAYFPRQATSSGKPPQDTRWVAGDPLTELAETRKVSISLPRTLLPRFPDDPKARFMQDLDDEVGLVEESSTTASPAKRKTGRWKNVHDLQRFWEAMEFRQECSSGRVVGFLWMTVTPVDVSCEASEDDSEDGASSPKNGFKSKSQAANRRLRVGIPKKMRPTKTATKRRSKTLTGAIITRTPKIKSTQANPLQSINLNDASDGILIPADSYDKLMHTLLHLDFGKQDIAAHSTRKWIEEIAGLCGQPKHRWGVPVLGTAVMAAPTENVPVVNGGVNDLGGMIRKKRKAPPPE